MALNQRHFFYWILPALVGALLVGMYFSGIPWMQSFVGPEINREFGALENLEHLIIFALIVIAVLAIGRKTLKWEKRGFALVAAGSLFLLLEELDYGLHFVEYFSGEPHGPGVRNLHNYILNPYGLDFDAVLSPVIYCVLGVFFCFLPFVMLASGKPWLRPLKLQSFAARYSAHPWLRYLTPEPYSIGTIAIMVGVAQAAFLLDKMEIHSNLMFKGNISEFGELFVHYVFFLYFFELVYKRKTPLPVSSGEPSEPLDGYLRKEYPVKISRDNY